MVIPRDLYGVPRVPFAGVFEGHQISALRQAGHHVGVLSGGVITTKHLGRRFPYSRMEVMDGLPVYRAHRRAYLPARWERPHVGAQRSFNRLRPVVDKYLKEQGTPDIVHAHNLAAGGALARLLHEEFGLPYVVTEHSTMFAVDPAAVARARLAIASGAEKSSRIIAVGNHLADRLRLVLPPAAAARTVVVPNVVDPALWLQPLASPEAGSFTISALGNLVPRKNYGLLLRAFAQADLPADARLVIGGGGPEKDRLLRIASDLAIEARVEFRGPLDRAGVWDMFRRSSVFAHPSNYETFGVVLIEAMAFGTPSVATACGGPDDIVTTDVGRLVPTHDVDGFAAALTEVHRTRDQFRPAELHEQCRTRFGPETFASTMGTIYEDVLS